MAIRRKIMNISPIPITRDGYERSQKEFAELTEKRKEVLEHLKRAREMGDLSENGYYKASKMQLSDIDHRLHRLQMVLKYGKIVENTGTGVVDIGCKVTVTDGKFETTYLIVGGHESNPLEKKISH